MVCWLGIQPACSLLLSLSLDPVLRTKNNASFLGCYVCYYIGLVWSQIIIIVGEHRVAYTIIYVYVH